MPLPEKQRWEEVMRDFLDGIEGELRSSPPLKSKADLSKFRNRLNRKRVEGGRNRFEQELEELCDGRLNGIWPRPRAPQSKKH